MENLVKQISMRIFGVEEENKTQTSRVIRDRKISSRRTRSSKRDSWKDQSRRQLSHETSRDHDKTESEEFRTAVAAAAFAINSLESKRQKIKQDPCSKSRKTSSEILEAPSRPEVNEDLPSGSGVNQPALTTEANSSVANIIKLDDKTSLQKEPEIRLGEADIWEKTEMEKIKERSMKLKARIFGWEKKKKAKAKNKFTRKEGEIEWQRAQALLDFAKKMEMIEKISMGARSQNDKKQKDEEMKVKEKANMIRKTGNIPKPTFLCC